MAALSTPVSRFFDYLLKMNPESLKDFRRWRFQPGMLFNAWEQWWGREGRRASAHEGIDLCSFEDGAGQINFLDGTVQVPATFAGAVVKIERDFLGQSIYLRHAISSGDGGRLLTAYGHTRPVEGLAVGRHVAEGEIIASLAPVPVRKNGMRAHLHLTLAWAPAALPLDRLTWENLGRDEAIRLIDPLAVLATPVGRNLSAQ
jgi:hypothetical protein